MVITDKFVYIHMAKTGGTFVENVLSRLLSTRSRVYLDTATAEGRRQLPQLFYHSGMRRLPGRHRRKKILFTIRNPYDYYVSRYEYAAEYLPYGIFYGRRMKMLYPHYPRLTFAEYMEAINNWNLKVLRPRPDGQSFARLPAESNIGNMTWFFIQLLFSNPQKLIRNLDRCLDNGEQLKALPPDLHFIRTENLNRELYEFLLTIGHEPQELEFILRLGKIYPPEGGRVESQEWEHYYTPELKGRVRERDRLIFHMFPDYDV
ncbi:MAG TPA: hypothetical protein VGO91_02770 [Pyrinomonadaceae bacterium]|jgi:hypothetical protein|nr:hypothetical protein [Pyrinomonadaceae bacterium]